MSENLYAYTLISLRTLFQSLYKYTDLQALGEESSSTMPVEVSYVATSVFLKVRTSDAMQLAIVIETTNCHLFAVEEYIVKCLTYPLCWLFASTPVKGQFMYYICAWCCVDVGLLIFLADANTILGVYCTK